MVLLLVFFLNVYVFIYTAKSPAELNVLLHDSSIISEHQESSSFTMKRSVIVQSSSSHVTSSVSTANAEPNVQVHSYTSQSEKRFEQIGDNRPVQVGFIACSDPGVLQHDAVLLGGVFRCFKDTSVPENEGTIFLLNVRKCYRSGTSLSFVLNKTYVQPQIFHFHI